MRVMSVEDLEIDLDDLQRRMDGALGALRSEFAALRTGDRVRAGFSKRTKCGGGAHR